MPQIKRAIISVSDKTGLEDFAKELHKRGVEILSTGGTAAFIRSNNIPVRDVSDYTGFPEMMDGRVKTLHPKVHGGILALRDNSEHTDAMKTHGIEQIDMLVINLYPFKKTIEKVDCTFEDAIENIDIGGPAMLRSSAKNHKWVTVLTDPADYKSVLEEMDKNSGNVSYETNLRLAVKVFKQTSEYDGMISNYLSTKIN